MRLPCQSTSGGVCTAKPAIALGEPIQQREQIGAHEGFDESPSGIARTTRDADEYQRGRRREVGIGIAAAGSAGIAAIAATEGTATPIGTPWRPEGSDFVIGLFST
jgi:hypothetical protein